MENKSDTEMDVLCSEIEALGLIQIDDLELNFEEKSRHIASYCITLIAKRFYGQTSTDNCTDENSVIDLLNLGTYLECLDKFLRKFDNVTDFTGTEEEYLSLLQVISVKRKWKEEKTSQVCYEKLLNDSERFVELYHKRGRKSEVLEHRVYWGTRQQLLFGKVVGDWIDKEYGQLDPIFGVLLNPTGGRVGPGDSSWMHSWLFDNCGPMAYHSAVHDGFGYLCTGHSLPPGYTYLRCGILNPSNPMGGQINGVLFWNQVFDQIKKRQIDLKLIFL